MVLRKPRKSEDILWKIVIDDLLRYLVALCLPQVSRVIDFDRGVEFLDKELAGFQRQSGNKGTLFVDKLVKAYQYTSGKPLIFHIEVQGTQQKQTFGGRMFRYFSRIFEKHRAPITALAMFTDNNPQFRPDSFNIESFGTALDYRFNTYKILDQDEQELRKNPNPFAVVILTALLAIQHPKASDEQILEIKLDLIRELERREMPDETQQSILFFITHYAPFKNKEFITIFENKIKPEVMGIRTYLMEQGKALGIKEGKLEERAKTRQLLKAERAKAEKEKQAERAKAEKELKAKNRTLARAFKQLGMTIEQICKETGLSPAEIQAL